MREFSVVFLALVLFPVPLVVGAEEIGVIQVFALVCQLIGLVGLGLLVFKELKRK